MTYGGTTYGGAALGGTSGNLLPTTTATTPVEAIEALLENADSSVWRGDDPTVFTWWCRAQAERGPGQGQPPELYVSSLTGAPIDRLSADGALLQEEPTVEIWVYSLDESVTATLARDVIQYMSAFMDDQEQHLPYVDVMPSNVEDYREQKMTRHTGHFIYQVEVSMEQLNATGVA